LPSLSGCQSRRESAVAFALAFVLALAFLAVIPEGNLLFLSFSQEKDAFLSKEAFARAMAVEPSWRTNSSACRKTPSE